MSTVFEFSQRIDEQIDPYFYSLVSVQKPKQKRNCLRCRREFYSSHNGNRCCGACAARNSREPYKAEEMVLFH